MSKSSKTKKPRQEVVEFYTNSFNGNIELQYNFLDETLAIKNADVYNAKMETTYIKDSGKEKRTNSTPINPHKLTFNSHDALHNNYDLLVAIDTNTINIDGQRVSVTMSYFLEKPLKYYDKQIPFLPGACYLFVDVEENINAEKLGWHTIISNNINLNIARNFKIGLIVDCDLGLHSSINNRDHPYFEDSYLPSNMNLIYASSDSTTDSLQNKMISFCDKFANKVIKSKDLLNHLVNGKFKYNLPYCNKYCEIKYLKEPIK